MSEKIQVELEELWPKWERGQMDILSAATLKRYRSVLNRFVAWFDSAEMRSSTVADWHPITLVGYRQHLEETSSTSTINTHLSALRRFGEWLIGQGFVDANPARRLKLAKQQEKSAPMALEASQVNALLRAIQLTRNPQRNVAIVQMMLQTGMRVGECAALTCKDIEFGERRGIVIIRFSKGGKTRRTPLNRSARQALTDYLAPQLEVDATLKSMAKAWPRLPKRRALWLSERGTQLSAREMSRMFRQQVLACAARGQVPLQTTLHSLRHTFATHYLRQHPSDLIGLAWLLGHASIRTTQIYVQPTEEEMARRVDAILLNAYAG